MTGPDAGRRLAKAHFWCGGAGLAVFLASGLFLRVERPHLIAAGATLRLLYRARHIHLLTSSLLHLLAAASYRNQAQVLLRDRIGSLLLLAASPTLLWAFVSEPPLGFGHARFVLLGMLLLSFGTLLRVAGTLGPARR